MTGKELFDELCYPLVCFDDSPHWDDLEGNQRQLWELIAETITEKYLDSNQKADETKVELLSSIEWLSTRLHNGLRCSQYRTVQEISELTRAEFLTIRNLGQRSYIEMREHLKDRGLSFKNQRRTQ